MQQRPDPERRALRQQAQPGKQQPAGGHSGLHFPACRQHPAVHRQKAQQKAFPADHLFADLLGKPGEPTPGEDPAACGGDQLQQIGVAAVAQQKGEQQHRQQKQKDRYVAVRDLGQQLNRMDRQQRKQRPERVLCKCLRTLRGSFQIRLPQLLPGQAGKQRRHGPFHPPKLQIFWQISSKSGHAAPSTRQRPANPAHQPRELAPASSQKVRA